MATFQCSVTDLQVVVAKWIKETFCLWSMLYFEGANWYSNWNEIYVLSWTKNHLLQSTGKLPHYLPASKLSFPHQILSVQKKFPLSNSLVILMLLDYILIWFWYSIVCAHEISIRGVDLDKERQSSAVSWQFCRSRLSSCCVAGFPRVYCRKSVFTEIPTCLYSNSYPAKERNSQVPAFEVADCCKLGQI